MILNRLKQSPFFQTFKKALEESSSLLLESLWDSPKASLIHLLLEFRGKNLLVITGGEREDHLIQDLKLLSPFSPYLFPAWDTLPGEEMPPNLDLVGKRFEVLHQLLTQKGPHLILTPLQGALQMIPSPSLLQKHLSIWKKGSHLSFDTLPITLSHLGYERKSVAIEKGEYAVRGGIIDLFPISAALPYRVEFFGDQVEEIRTYDPMSQKSIEKIESFLLSPASEKLLLEKGSSYLLDLIGKESTVCFDDLLAIEDRLVKLKDHPAFSRSSFLPFPTFLEKAQPMQKLFFSNTALESLFSEIKQEGEELSFEIFNQRMKAKKLSHPFIPVDFAFPGESKAKLQKILKEKTPTLFLTASSSEKRALFAIITETHLPFPPAEQFIEGYLSSGYYLQDLPLLLLPYSELSKRQKVNRQKWRTTYHTPPSDFHLLSPGDLVVHLHNGVGKFLGIEKQKSHLGLEEEFLLIEYANASKLYVPLSQSHLVSRYIGAREEHPSLSILGNKKWGQTKAKAEKAIVGYAQDLLKMQAERSAKGGFAFPGDSEEMILFEEEFPFIETEDQKKAILEIKEDMLSSKSMDRLLCGDVGYGKTEVAMRAAFKAVVDGGKQVAVLTPTTVLAMQHYDTFKARMGNFPVKIGVASRFVKPKELKEILSQVEKREIDILIGTHRILSKEVRFSDLGLIIIDEEQRFGVRAKEHLKKIKIGVDTLTLSATPIPRTLYFSLVGMRDLSVINSPPQDRLPIKTIIAEKEPAVVQNALARELAREGQAYVIHNRVETIYKIKEEVEVLLPHAKIDVVHGQMSPDAIDFIFHQFKIGAIDILIATTILENGVDIPNANTILVDRSDTYGMADLYQLRGRVGRWNRPAFAYFLIPKSRELSEISRKRLQALVETSGFGGGMKLAMRDLELRGAGDLLGVQQSGQLSSIGFHFYCKLLKRAIATIKKEIPLDFTDTKIEFSYPASLPPSYLPERNLRMELYHRIGEASSEEELSALFAEIKDRFGELPEETHWLYFLSRLRLFTSLNRFSFLKIQKSLLTVEREEKEGTIQKKIPFPELKAPEEVDTLVIPMLKHAFKIAS